MKAFACLLTGGLILPLAAQAGPSDRAKRLFERVAGVPPSPSQMAQMVNLLNQGKAEQAVDVALSDPSFYNLSLKRLVSPWTNSDQNPNIELNDYSATVIGLVRDNRDFREILYGDYIYRGSNQGMVGVPEWDWGSNQHYAGLESKRVNLADPSNLVKVSQIDTLFLNPVPATPTDSRENHGSDPAGILTTRAAAVAFLQDGTNRRMIRFTLANHLCRDLETLRDIALSDDRVRRDVDRSPGGNSALYLTKCKGCHSVQDPLAGAFAYFQYKSAGSRMLYFDQEVQRKVIRNGDVFPQGHQASDNHWENKLAQDVSLGWRGSHYSEGLGAQALGRALAQSKAFSRCQITKVFKHVCKREPGAQDQSLLDQVFDTFENTEYLGSKFNLKTVFRKVAPACIP